MPESTVSSLALNFVGSMAIPPPLPILDFQGFLCTGSNTLSFLYVVKVWPCFICPNISLAFFFFLVTDCLQQQCPDFSCQKGAFAQEDGIPVSIQRVQDPRSCLICSPTQPRTTISSWTKQDSGQYCRTCTCCPLTR